MFSSNNIKEDSEPSAKDSISCQYWSEKRASINNIKSFWETQNKRCPPGSLVTLANRFYFIVGYCFEASSYLSGPDLKPTVLFRTTTLEEIENFNFNKEMEIDFAFDMFLLDTKKSIEHCKYLLLGTIDDKMVCYSIPRQIYLEA
jgi:hypothetical protein